MKTSDRDKRLIRLYRTKKCPECRQSLALNANVCTWCKKKVGKVMINGYAERPVDWRGYMTCLLSWVALVFYLWWAFLGR